jgi:dihydrofolate synthase/folylpolyglutamate synthase
MTDLRKYLDSLPDLGACSQSGMRSSDFTLERMEILMQALGHPERQFPSIHIAGTNGKGSVVAFCAAALQTQGYKVGSFTSPHLDGALAGIAVNGVRVQETELRQSFETLYPHLKSRNDWTQFEAVTALMFVHFARVKGDVGVVEVGLGGRLDATNVLRPLVSVITPIDYDHTSILGNSLAGIAKEKAGIIKDGVPVVMAPQTEEARASILQVANEKNAEVIVVGRDIRFERISSDLSGQVFELTTPSPTFPLDKGKGGHPTRLGIQMLGIHQIENAATAYAALRIANQRGLTVSEAALQRGFAAARWPGRFEVHLEPLVVLDAAHSPAATQALRNALDKYFPGRPIIMVIGVSADKDLAGIIDPLRPRITRIVATQSSHPRAMPAGELSTRLAQIGVEAEHEVDGAKATKKAMQFVQGNEVILVCGSVFLVEQLRSFFTGNSPVD